MPEMVRTAQRGWLRLFNNDYFSEELIQVDSEEVAWLSIFTILFRYRSPDGWYLRLYCDLER
jgi:hypothetical protein